MKNRIVTLVLAACFTALCSVGLCQELRHWTSSSGLHSVQGRLDAERFLAEDSPKSIVIRNDEEQTAFECAVNKLSSADQAYLERVRQAYQKATGFNRDVLPYFVDDPSRPSGTRATFTYDRIEYAFVWIAPGAAVEPDDALTPDALKRPNAPTKAKPPKRGYVVSQGFWMLESEVTLAMWRSFLNDSEYTPEKGNGTRLGYLPPPADSAGVIDGDFNWKQTGFAQTDEHPVTLITHADARAFCKWLSSRVSMSLELPRRDQWRLASQPSTRRALTSSQTLALWLFGGDVMWERGNLPDANFRLICPQQAPVMEMVYFAPRDSCRYTAPVKSYRPNGNGLYDIIGNVGEMTLEGNSAPDIVNSLGGSWFHLPNFNSLCWRSIPIVGDNRFESSGLDMIASVANDLSNRYAVASSSSFYAQDYQAYVMGVDGSNAPNAWVPVTPQDVVATCYTGFRPVINVK